MGIREVTSEHGTAELNIGSSAEDGLKLHRVWELNVLGVVLQLERYGSMCGWNLIKLKRDGAEVYRVVKNWGDEERREFFSNRLTRTYEGDQLSFVEYAALIAEHELFPTAEEFVQAGLDANTERLYRDNIQRILDRDASTGN